MEISKIKLPNGETYDLKDTELRKEIEKLVGPIDKEKNDGE